jgi:DNA polymerase III subunit gamma/tau
MPSYLVLARKYRPAKFSEVVGQDHVVQTLSNSIVSGRVAHAFLFSGVRGVGKTTVARILAKTLNCLNRTEGVAEACNNCSSCREISSGISVDVQEIDGASHTSVDNIREINENIKYPPTSSAFKIIIIDEVHMISINAFNALLKTLEEPPPHAKFIFATTESHKVPATIASRCQKFHFRTISVSDIIAGMSRILQQENIESEDEALALIAREAQGSFRDALSLLDQVIAFNPHAITAQDVVGILGLSGHESLARLTTAILNRDAAAALGFVQELFQQGQDPEQFVLNLVRYFRNLTVVKTVPRSARVDGMIDAPPSELQEMENLVETRSIDQLYNLLNMLIRAESEIKRAGDAWIALELTVLRMANAPDFVELSRLIRRLEAVPPPRAETISRSPVRMPAAPLPDVRSTGKKAATPSVEPERADKVPGREEDDSCPEPRATSAAKPLPSERPDEIWSMLKDRVQEWGEDPALRSIMDHGNLIAFGHKEVEIGFTRSLYKEDFEKRLADKQDLKGIFREFFGNARLKILTLSRETSLASEKPYGVPADGQTDLDRALKHEARENPITLAVLDEFEGSYIEDVRVIGPKP